MPITTNAIMTGARGTFGKQVVFKKYGDKTVISDVPDFSKRILSPKQLKNNETMVDAHDYAKEIIADDKLKNEAQVRLNVQRNKLYTSLIREYYKNNYRVDEKENEGKVAAPAKTEANMPFVTYLLENTNKSIEEISMLTNTPVDVVETLKKSRSKS
jgi:hypothetical protein